MSRSLGVERGEERLEHVEHADLGVKEVLELLMQGLELLMQGSAAMTSRNTQPSPGPAQGSKENLACFNSGLLLGEYTQEV